MRTRCFFYIAVVVAAVPVAVSAQPSSVPVTASLVVRLTAATSRYHMGERIPFELEFRGIAEADYYFSTDSCGPFGRLLSEHVVVTPADAVEDPLADLFASAGITGSCLSSFQALDGTPLVIQGSLNDWVRFTRPGTYTVVVSSTRLQRHSRQAVPPMVSIPITVTIAPIDTAWAAAEVFQAGELIDHGDPSEVTRGTAILRDLGTEAAARALVDRYDTIDAVDGNGLLAGITSSPHRALIIRELETRMDAGDDLPPTLIATLTRLRVLQELPPTEATTERRWKRMPVVEAEYDARWRAAIERRAVTAATLRAELARLATNPRPDLQERIAHNLEQHPAEATNAFFTLPSATQTSLLESTTTWRSLERPWMVAALRELYSKSYGQLSPGGLPDSPGDPALRRLYELAPDEGRPLVLEEIRTGEHGVSARTLAILPDSELPQLDSATRARYASPHGADGAAMLGDRGTTAWLIARYGSVALMPFVRDAIDRPLCGCDVEAALIVYLLKHDPAPAMRRLEPGLDRTASGSCVAPPLSLIASRYWDSRTEAVATAYLMNGTVTVVMAGVEALRSNGSIGAKQSLFDRLARWSAEWRGRDTELAEMQSSRSATPADIEPAIVNALFHNVQFKVSIEDAENIRRLCVTDGCRTQVDGEITARRPRYASLPQLQRRGLT